MVQKLWILDPKIKISSPFQIINLWSEFQTWFSNLMILKSCLACFKDSKKPPRMEVPESRGWFYPQSTVISVVSVSESEKDVSLINPEALDKTADAFIYAVTFW